MLRKWIVSFLEASPCCNVNTESDEELWKDLSCGADWSKPPIPTVIEIPCQGKFSLNEDLCSDENSALYGGCSEVQVDEIKLFYRPEAAEETTSATTETKGTTNTEKESSTKTWKPGQTWTSPTTRMTYGFI